MKGMRRRRNMAAHSIGKVRGLTQLATKGGVFAILALDQRGALKRMMKAAGVSEPGYAHIVRTKLEIVRHLSPLASGVLLDPEYGAAQCVAALALSGSTGLVAALEQTGYSEEEGDRFATVLEDWDVGKIKRMGASAVKLLVYYNPHRRRAAGRQEKLIEEVAAACRAYDIPFMLEALVYPSEGMDAAAFVEAKERLVIESAEALTRFDIDLYKVEFPVHPEGRRDPVYDAEACQKLSAACRTPWALLSAGVPFERYSQQLKAACEAGASGFVAGRAIWREAVELTDPQERQTFMRTEMRRRFQQLADCAEERGRPWHEAGSLAYDANQLVSGPDWFASYPSI